MLAHKTVLQRRRVAAIRRGNKRKKRWSSRSLHRIFSSFSKGRRPALSIRFPESSCLHARARAREHCIYVLVRQYSVNVRNNEESSVPLERALQID